MRSFVVSCVFLLFFVCVTVFIPSSATASSPSPSLGLPQLQVVSRISHAPLIEMLDTKSVHINEHFTPADQLRLRRIVADLFRLENYRKLRIQIIENSDGMLEHYYMLVYLFSPIYHSFDLVRVDFDRALKVLKVEKNYVKTKKDRIQQSLRVLDTPVCPDDTIQFIAICPNGDDQFEMNVTTDVANTAVAKGLNTVWLLGDNATSTNFVNYLSCPKLQGSFYDGDADPSSIVTSDGSLDADTISSSLAGAFRNEVVNIWLACEAFNDPMKTAMTTTTLSQRYAAGINDLLVGPSDNAAACAMKAAINGQGLDEAWASCQTQYDNSSDQWGWGGQGSDQFGH